MKRILLASSALAVLAGVQQAQAASDMYVSVLGGANFLSDDSQRFTSFYSTASFETDADTGFVLGGAIGTRLDKWAQGLRAEVEVAYRRNDVGGRWTTSTGSTGGSLDGNMSTFSIMANAWYDIDIGTKIRPYVGGGVGWARTRGEFAQVSTFTDGGTPGSTYIFRSHTETENSGFAWQLGLGFNYEVAPDVDVGIGYRYFVGPRISEVVDFEFNGDDKIDNENHAVQVNLTIGIN
jgi:opacity protein-like surface antigen